MIPSHPSVTTANSSPVDQPTAPAPSPEASSKVLELPPVKGSLPYTREDYEKLPWYEKTPGLDFLVPGKIPGGKPPSSDAPLPANAEFDSAVLHCLLEGELSALDFLWRESGRDPGRTTIDLTRQSLDKDAAAVQVGHCADHPGLKVDLCLREHNADILGEVSRLIAKGNVNQLLLYRLSAGQLEQLAPDLGKVGAELCLRNTPISPRCEQLLAQSLGESRSLSMLMLGNCEFGDAGGKHFIDGMLDNRSIRQLEMDGTPLPTVADGGYGTLLANSRTLQTLKVSRGSLRPRLDMEAILDGVLNDHVLRELHIKTSGYSQDDPGKLCTRLETNRTLTRLTLPAGLASDEAYAAVAASLAKNTSLIEFVVEDARPTDDDFAGAVDDLMSRNRELANDQNYLLKAGRALDPTGNSGLADAGSLIAEQIFLGSSSRDEFMTAMTEIELSLKEIEKRTKPTSS